MSNSISLNTQFISGEHKPLKVLIIGQIYQDTILTVDDFPQEDTKTRAQQTTFRWGGSCINIAEILVQFPKAQPHIMSAVGPKETVARMISSLDSKGIKTYCFHRKQSTPSCYVIHSKLTGSRTTVSCDSSISGISREEFVLKLEINQISKTMSFDFDYHNVAFDWIHFEGRNCESTLSQISWLEAKTKGEGGNDRLMISIEFEDPDRPGLDNLLSKGDVLFFSKAYVTKKGFNDPKEFIRYYQPKSKPGSILFCTWGSYGAACSSRIGDILCVPAPPKDQASDLAGAGDTFIAGIIYCLGRGYSLWFTLKFACELASREVTQTELSDLSEHSMISNQAKQPNRSSSLSPVYKP
ncbi:Ribokinase-like protein [Blakeslea trispora]|nr:Ribokinase-like protein [Blakeslea trispora]